MTYLVKLVHEVEDRHPMRVSRGNSAKAYRRSVLGATPAELYMLQKAAYNLPDGSGRKGNHLNRLHHYKAGAKA